MNLQISHVAPLVDPTRLHIAHPWHCTKLDRDVVTDGLALLVWSGRQFAERTANEGENAPPDIASILAEGGPDLGGSTITEILDWADESVPSCRECYGPALPRRCAHCAAVIAPCRPGLFFGVVVDRELLVRFFEPLRWAAKLDAWVRVCGRGEGQPVHMIGDEWTVVAMPMAPGTDPAGPAFPAEASS